MLPVERDFEKVFGLLVASDVVGLAR